MQMTRAATGPSMQPRCGPRWVSKRHTACSTTKLSLDPILVSVAQSALHLLSLLRVQELHRQEALLYVHILLLCAGGVRGAGRPHSERPEHTAAAQRHGQVAPQPPLQVALEWATGGQCIRLKSAKRHRRFLVGVVGWWCAHLDTRHDGAPLLGLLFTAHAHFQPSCGRWCALAEVLLMLLLGGAAQCHPSSVVVHLSTTRLVCRAPARGQCQFGICALAYGMPVPSDREHALRRCT